MATHLAEGRTFPLLFYGQNYLLGVEAWLAAPLFWLFGPSLALLRLAVLGVNLAIAWLLIRLLVADAGLTPLQALGSSLFLTLAPVIASSKLLEAADAGVEPFLYALLLWMTRSRPILFGIIAGVGFMNREFTAYAIVAIVLLEATRRAFYRLAPIRSRALSLFVMALVVYAIERLNAIPRSWDPGAPAPCPAPSCTPTVSAASSTSAGQQANSGRTFSGCSSTTCRRDSAGGSIRFSRTSRAH